MTQTGVKLLNTLTLMLSMCGLMYLNTRQIDPYIRDRSMKPESPGWLLQYVHVHLLYP